MAEYINRERARFEAKRYFKNMGEIQEDLDMLFCMLPAENVSPVRHGQWAYYDTYIDGITIFRCTCCGDLQSGRDGWGWKKSYCPNCGARMDGGNDD